MIGRIQINNKNVKKSSIFCQGTKAITAIVESGRPVVRQSASVFTDRLRKTLRPTFQLSNFGGLGLWLRVGVLGSVNPNRYPYPNPNNNTNANPTLTLIVTLTPNLPWL